MKKTRTNCPILICRLCVSLAVALPFCGSGYGQDSMDTPMERLEAAVEQDPQNVMLQLRLGEAYLQAGETGKGQALLADVQANLESLSAANPESGKLRYALGLCLLFRGDGDGAEAAFESAIELDPDFTLASLGLAKVYAEAGSYYRAIAVVRTALERDPEDEALRRTLAELFASNGKLDLAIEAYEALAEDYSDNPRYAERLLGLYINIGDVDRSKPLLERFVEAGKLSETESQLHLVKLYLDEGNPREVPGLLQRIRRADPAHPMLDGYFASYYRLLGRQSAETAEWSRASLYFNRSLEYEPGDAETIQSLGSAYLKMKDFEAANEQFLSILESTPSDPAFYVDFARTQMALGNPKLAFQVVEKAYESSRSRGDLEAMRQFEQARSELKDTLREQAQAAEPRQDAAKP